VLEIPQLFADNVSMNDTLETVEEEFTALAVAYGRAVVLDNPMAGAYQKLSLAKSIARDAEAIGAEMVVARFLGDTNFKATLNTFKNKADCLGIIEVKHTNYRDGHLIIKRSDRNSDLAVLVTGNSPNYEIMGWYPVGLAKAKRFQSSDGSWWVSQLNLEPMESLRSRILCEE
jgi:hypothetical protein